MLRPARIIILILIPWVLILNGCLRNRITVPAIASRPAGKYLHGRVVWHDILTDDPAAAKAFYQALFGWEFKGRGGDDAPYLTAFLNDIPVSGFVKSDRLESGISESRWVGYISVADIDRTAGKILSLQGLLFMPPRELPDRGMVALAGDPQGGCFGLITTWDGDPEATEAPVHGWLWNELLSTRPDSLAPFYRAVFNYRLEVYNEKSIFLMTGTEKQAGIVPLPGERIQSVWLPYIRVASVHQTLRRAESLGGKEIFRANLNERPAAILADPTGAIVGIQEWF